MALEPVALLGEMLSIPSVSGDEGKLVSRLVDTLSGHGFRAHRDEAGNLVATIGEGPTTHVLLGHIDTVPGEIPVRLEDGFLWGRGAVDAKGPLAAFLVAAERIGPVPGHRLVVIGAVEEEAPSSKGAWFVRDRYAPVNTIVGEPSGASSLTLGYKGRLFARFALARPRAHSSIPEPTPTEHAVRLWLQALAEAGPTSGGDAGEGVFERLQPSLDHVATRSDPFTAGVEATIGFRLPPGCDVARLKQRLQAATPVDATLAFDGEVAAYRAGKGTPVVRAFLAAMRDLGLAPRFKVKTGTADMNVVGPLWGPSILAYGPGDARLDHAPDERIAVAEYLLGIDVLAGALRRLLGLVSGPAASL